MTTDLIPVDEIVEHYSPRSIWRRFGFLSGDDVSGFDLTDGSRLVLCAAGDGFRIYHPSRAPIYVPFV